MQPEPNMTPLYIGFAIWLGVAVIAIGVIYERAERAGEWSHAATDAAIVAAFWPLFALFGAGAVVLWSLLWLGRGPVRLVVWLRRPKLPRAEVRR